MKTTRIILLLAASILALSSNRSHAQPTNWRSWQGEQAHIISVQFGLDFGFVLGVGYAYKLNTSLPILLNVDVSMPFGETLLDDYKIRIGGQAELVRLGDFSTTIKAQCVVRRLDNLGGKYLNLGSELGIIAGFYRSTWFVAGEFTYDKTLLTNIQHSEDAKKNSFHQPQDGWYSSLGGNFLYGIQGGYSFSTLDLNARLGAILTEDFKGTPMYIPFYGTLGMNVRF
jgi:hypothetical protein